MTDTPITDKAEEDAVKAQQKLADETNQAALDSRDEDQKRQAEQRQIEADFERKLRDYQFASTGYVRPPTAEEPSDEEEAPKAEEKPEKTAHEVVEEIDSSDNADEVRSLSKGDDRKTVQKAAEKRLADLEDDPDEE